MSWEVGTISPSGISGLYSQIFRKPYLAACQETRGFLLLVGSLSVFAKFIALIIYCFISPCKHWIIIWTYVPIDSLYWLTRELKSELASGNAVAPPENWVTGLLLICLRLDGTLDMGYLICTSAVWKKNDWEVLCAHSKVRIMYQIHLRILQTNISIRYPKSLIEKGTVARHGVHDCTHSPQESEVGGLGWDCGQPGLLWPAWTTWLFVFLLRPHVKGPPPLSRDHQVEKGIRGRGCGGERSSAEAFLGHFRIFISVIKQYDQSQLGEEKAYFILKACSTSSWKVKRDFF